MYEEVLVSLRKSYAPKVDERDNPNLAPWKRTQCGQFLSLLRDEGKVKLLDIGAGTGIQAEFFRDGGLNVVCTDLSPEMVIRCREKGLEAYVMDFLSLEFPAGAFDAVFAMNCLLHVPKLDLPNILAVIRRVMTPGGLFYWGQFGGIDEEGIWQEDQYEPKRFFSLLTDAQIGKTAAQHFEMLSFDRIELERDRPHFQSMLLRSPKTPTQAG